MIPKSLQNVDYVCNSKRGSNWKNVNGNKKPNPKCNSNCKPKAKAWYHFLERELEIQTKGTMTTWILKTRLRLG